jgi:hypothetical protein
MQVIEVAVIKIKNNNSNNSNNNDDENDDENTDHDNYNL